MQPVGIYVIDRTQNKKGIQFCSDTDWCFWLSEGSLSAKRLPESYVHRGKTMRFVFHAQGHPSKPCAHFKAVGDHTIEIVDTYNGGVDCQVIPGNHASLSLDPYYSITDAKKYSE